MTDPDARRKMLDEHLPAIVDEVLAAPEIIAGLRQARLTPDQVRGEVLAPTDATLDQLLGRAQMLESVIAAKGRQTRRLALAQMIGGGLTIAGLAVVPLLVDLTVPRWSVFWRVHGGRRAGTRVCTRSSGD